MTTTFNVLTLQTPITFGNIYFDGISIKDNPTAYHRKIGYCPKKSAILPFMTAYETIKYTALMRSSNRDTLHEDINLVMRRLDLKKYAHMRTKFFAPATRRKLNLAIALLSRPRLLILDEPTAGVDPPSHRYIWSCILDCLKSNMSVLFTSQW